MWLMQRVAVAAGGGAGVSGGELEGAEGKEFHLPTFCLLTINLFAD